MRENFRKSMILVVILSTLITAFTGCAETEKNVSTADVTNEAAPTGETSSTEVITIKAIANNNYYPLVYLDDNGILSGYAIDVNTLIDEALPQYEYNIETASGDAILLGLQSGKYDVALGGFYWNEEREKTFLFPENFSGGGIVGVETRKEDSDVKNLADAVAKGLRFAPTGAGGGIIGVIDRYNEENPDSPVVIEQAESLVEADILQGVVDGRYDVNVGNRHSYNQIIDTEGQEAIRDGIVFNSFTVVKSYDLFNKSQTEFAKAYDEQLAKLREDGTLSELSIKWFGEDLFQLVGEY